MTVSVTPVTFEEAVRRAATALNDGPWGMVVGDASELARHVLLAAQVDEVMVERSRYLAQLTARESALERHDGVSDKLPSRCSECGERLDLAAVRLTGGLCARCALMKQARQL